MEIKATLNKPYTEEQRTEFIVDNNHRQGYEIRETQIALEAWGYTNEELLTQAKTDKHEENTIKAKEAIESGYVVYKDAQFETNTQTLNDLDGERNLCLLQGLTSTMWLSKDDKTVELLLSEENPIENDDIVKIGLLAKQFKGYVWTVKYLAFKQQIEEATTVEEVKAIEINYDVPEILESLS